MSRVNELATTALDTAGVVLFAVAVWFLGQDVAGPVAGFGFAATVLILFSGLAQARQRPRRRPVAKPQRVAPPGPSDPGTVHVRG